MATAGTMASRSKSGSSNSDAPDGRADLGLRHDLPDDAQARRFYQESQAVNGYLILGGFALFVAVGFAYIARTGRITFGRTTLLDRRKDRLGF